MRQLEGTTTYRISGDKGFQVKDYSENSIILEGFKYVRIRKPHNRKRHKPYSEQIVLGNNVEFGCFSENTIYRFNSIQIHIEKSPESIFFRSSNIWKRIFTFITKKLYSNDTGKL